MWSVAKEFSEIMGLQLRREPSKKVRIITTLIAVFAFVAQPLYGLTVARDVNALAPTTVHSTDLSGWSLAESRSAGHTELVNGGLHVWTIASANGNYESKAAGYRAASFNLADAGDTSIEFSTYSGVRPSLQLGVDKDGNGSWDGYLVYEPWAYGDGNWWSSKDFGITAGGGYPSMGTISDYVTANPNAKVIAIGYSLGSGVVGDAVITKLSAGGTDYTFSTPPADTTGPSITDITPVNNARVAGTTRFSATVTDDSGVKKIAMYLRNQTGSNNEFALTKNPSNNTWYADVNTGNLAGDGTYDVVLRAVDNKNNVTYFNNRRDSFSVVVDNTNPSITVKNAPDTVGSLSAGIFSKAGFKLHDNDKVAKYSVNGTVSTVTPNAWSDANGIAVGKKGGQYGNNTITLYDLANNHVDYSFVLDNVAPTVTLKGSPDTIGSGSYSKVSFKLFDSYKVAKAEVNGMTINLNPNTWSDLNNIKVGSMGGILGDNVVKVYDLAGNVTTVNFTLDNVAPTATLAFPAIGPGATAFKVKFNEDVNKTDAENPANYFLHNWPGASSFESLVGHATVSYDEATTTATVTFTDGAWYVSGEQNWGVRNVHDIAGNQIAETSAYSSPMNGPLMTSVTFHEDHNDVTWNWTADDGSTGSGIKGYVYKLVKDDSTVIEDWTTTSGTSHAKHLDDGSYTFSVKARDNAGNEGNVFNLSFTLDSTAPVLTMSTPVLNEDGTYTVKVTTTDPTSDVQFYLDGTLISGATPNDDKTVWTIVTPALDPQTTHTVTAKSTDGAHNEATPASKSFTVPVVNSTPLSVSVPGQLAANTTGSFSNVAQPLDAQPVKDDDAAVLGAQTLKDSTGSDVASITASPEGWKIFGIAWYWILLAIAAVGGLGWMITAIVKRRAAQDV